MVQSMADGAAPGKLPSAIPIDGARDAAHRGAGPDYTSGICLTDCRWFENSVVLTLPNKSHSDTDACVMGLIESFILSKGRAPNAACLATSPPIDFLR